MLKIMKYDYKSVLSYAAFIILLALIMFVYVLSIVGNDTITLLQQTYIALYAIIDFLLYLVGIGLVIAVMSSKSINGVELYEMAGISPIKVAVSRLIMVFIAITSLVLVITLLETTMERYATSVEKFDRLDFLVFSTHNQGIALLLKPLFMGIFATVVYSSSLMVATMLRRIDRDVFKVIIIGCVCVFVVWAHIIVVYRIDFVASSLNMNNWGLLPAIPVERDIEIINMIRPNYLNIMLIAYHSLYVGAMLTIYSLRRKLV